MNIKKMYRVELPKIKDVCFGDIIGKNFFLWENNKLCFKLPTTMQKPVNGERINAICFSPEFDFLDLPQYEPVIEVDITMIAEKP